MNIFFLGFASGIPLALISGTFTNWLARSGIDKTSIGILSSVMMPYSLKFLWSFLLDTIPLPIISQKFGFRRSWILLSILLLFIAIIALGNIDPKTTNLLKIGFIALAVGFFSANLDISIDAYRIEIVEKINQAAAAATYTWGYRIAMLVSGGGALYLSEYYSWSQIYTIMGALLFIGIIPLLILGEPKVNQEKYEIKLNDSIEEKFRKLIILPLKELLTKDQVVWIFAFIICFKLTDSFLGTMASTFYVDMGYSNKDIAVVVKAYGLIFTLIGTSIGGIMLARWGYFYGLLVAGILQALSNLLYIILIYSGHDLNTLILVLAVENSTAALSGVMMIAYLSSLCSLQYSATHYALLSSFALIGRNFLSAPAGYIVDKFNWEIFIITSTLIAIPGLILLFILARKRII